MKTVSKNVRKKIKEEIIRIENIKGELTPQQRRRIEKNVIRKEQRKNRLRGILVALGITTVGVGGYLASQNQKAEEVGKRPEITEEQKDDKENNFKNQIKVEETDLNKENIEENNIDYEQIISEIIEEYNNEYDEDLKEEDLSYMKSNPQFLGIDKDGNYIQDYKEKAAVEKYITKDIDNIYVVINNKDNTVITSLGKVEKDIRNIDTKIIKGYGGKEYLESKNKIDLTKNKNKDDIKNIYDAMKNEYEKNVEKEI